jgi:nitrate/nitrite transporter NarK
MTSFRRAVLVLVVWGAATAFGLAFAAWTAVGPVLLTLTHRHGVHVGDLVAFVAAYSVAAALTRYLLRWPAAHSSR